MTARQGNRFCRAPSKRTNARLLVLLLLPIVAAVQAQGSSHVGSMPGMKSMAAPASAPRASQSGGRGSMAGMSDMANMPAMSSEPASTSAAHANSGHHRRAKKKAQVANTRTGSSSLNMHGMPMNSTPSSASAQMADMPGMAGMGGGKDAKSSGASSTEPVKPASSAAAMSGMKMDGMQMEALRPASGSGASGRTGSMNSMPAMADMPGTGVVKGATEGLAMPSGSMGSTAPMGAMDMGAMTQSMQGGSAPIGARDPDAYSDGLALGHMPGMDMMDNTSHVRLLADRVEEFRTHDSHGQVVDAQAWAGGDSNKLWMKLEGEVANGKAGATRSEALWAHTVTTYWDTQLGLRHDFGGGPQRNWAAFGIQGLAPYWFDIQATGYVGQQGRSALRLEAEYDLLLTQRLILQPDVQVNLYGKADPERKIGTGLSDIDTGLRLRYEVSRKFAPYLGVVWQRKFGHTATLSRAAGEGAADTQIVAGVRVWF